MADLLSKYAPRLTTLWKGLTGEELFLWNAAAPQAAPADVLRALLPALQADEQVLRLETGSGTWVAARSQRASDPFILFSRDPQQGDPNLLVLLVSLLDDLAEEKAANQQFTEELLSAWNRLNFLYEMARIALQESDLPSIITRLNRSLLQVISVEDICLVLEDGQSVQVYTASGRQIPALEGLAPFGSQAVPIQILLRGETLPAVLNSVSPSIQNLVVLTMSLEGHARGILGLINHPTGVIKATDRQLLFSAVEQVSMLINSTLARSVQEASRRLEHELNIASQIQANFLPKTLPDLPNLEFAVKLKPAYHIGGDFYDVQAIEDGLVIMVGDVAGKGIPAAMLTALIHATLKSEAQHHQAPASLLRSINGLIYGELDRSETFITAFLAVLHSSPLRLSYASAGHTTTLLWKARAQAVQKLTSTGLPLGISPQLDIDECTLDLEAGDTLILYSDGITEAENSHGRVFGTQALIDLVIAGQSACAADQLRVILSALDMHRGELALKDDVVLFLARTCPDPPVPARVIPFVYAAEKRSVRSLAILVRQVAVDIIFPTPGQRTNFLNELELAVSEIATNVVVHAYRDLPFAGRLQGRVTLWPDHVCVDLVDSGQTFIPDERLPDYSLVDPPTGGYGLLIARRLLHVCQYNQLEDGRNHWHLEKWLPARQLTAGV